MGRETINGFWQLVTVCCPKESWKSRRQTGEFVQGQNRSQYLGAASAFRCTPTQQQPKVGHD